ncbi:unnamed protein product, partial [Owenia fusiformis]
MEYLKMIQLLVVFLFITNEGAETDVKDIINGRPGDTINVPCTRAGLNTIQLEWRKDEQTKVTWDKKSGKPVYKNEEDEVKYTVNTSHGLIIAKADSTDDGTYTCIFKRNDNNGSRTNTENTEARVWPHCDPPQTDGHSVYSPMKGTYNEGESVQFMCHTENKTVKCIESGHGSDWSPKPPMCKDDQVGVPDGSLVAKIVLPIVGVIAVVVAISAYCIIRHRKKKTTDDGAELNDLSGSKKKRDEEEAFIDTNANTES